MLPFLFTTLKRRLGTEDTKWWNVSGVILSHSSCKQVLRWATVRGLRCRILRFKMRHTFSIGDRSGLQAGQSSTRTLFLRSQDFVMCAECGFALSCWNMHGRPWKRCLLEGNILYFSALMVPSQKCKLPLPRALTQPHTMTDPGFWTCCRIGQKGDLSDFNMEWLMVPDGLVWVFLKNCWSIGIFTHNHV